MTAYNMLISGSAAVPQLSYEFTMSSDTMAIEAAKRWAALITSDRYWRFSVWAANERLVVEFECKQLIEIKELTRA